MKNFIISISFLLSGIVFGQTIQDKSLLWEISGNGLKDKSYLFGTMHVMCQGDVVMDETMQKAINESKKIVLELDLDDPALMMQMMQLSMAKDGKTISSLLTPEFAQSVDAFLQSKAGLSLALVDNLNIMALVMQLSLLSMDCPLDQGYEMLFVQEAQKQNKEVLGLESLETQVKVLFGMSDEDAVEALTYIVNNNDEVVEVTSKLRNDYLDKNIQELYDSSVKSFQNPKYPQGNLEEFLDKRNENWIPVIEELIKNETVFIGVGAAHLAGDKGVINLLKKNGYQVTPVLK